MAAYSYNPMQRIENVLPTPSTMVQPAQVSAPVQQTHVQVPAPVSAPVSTPVQQQKEELKTFEDIKEEVKQKQTKKANQGGLIKDFVTKYLVKQIEIINKNGKKVVKHQAPTIKGISLSKLLKDYNDYKQEIERLSLEYNKIPLNDTVNKNKVAEQIESLKLKMQRLVENTIDINGFDFINEFKKVKGYTDGITDPTLLGLITMLSAKNADVNAIIKMIVEKYKFNKEETIESKNYPSELRNILIENNDRFYVKIFNNSVTHPFMLDKDGKQIPRKIGVKKGTQKLDYMKSYIMRSYNSKYFRTIVDCIATGVPFNKEVTLKNIATEYINEKKYVNSPQEVLNVLMQHYMKKPEELKALNIVAKEHLDIINFLKSYDKLIDELLKYTNLKAEYSVFCANYKIYEDVKKMEIKTTSTFDFLVSMLEILKALRKIKLDDEVLSEFIKQNEVRLPKSFKKNIMECIDKNTPIKLVDDTKKEEVEKDGKKKAKDKIKTEYYEFLKSDIDKMGTPKGDCYDYKKYSKIGSIVNNDINMIPLVITPNVKIALGLRIIIELKSIINEYQLNDIHDITIIC